MAPGAGPGSCTSSENVYTAALSGTREGGAVWTVGAGRPRGVPLASGGADQPAVTQDGDEKSSLSGTRGQTPTPWAAPKTTSHQHVTQTGAGTRPAATRAGGRERRAPGPACRWS